VSKQPPPTPPAAAGQPVPAGDADFDRRAYRGLTIAATGGTIAYAAVMGNFLALFANQLGFGPMLIGLLFLAVQAPALLQVFMAGYLDRHGGKVIVTRMFLVSSLALLPMIVAPQISNWLGPVAAVIAVFLAVLGYSLSNVPLGAAWYPLLRANLPDNRITGLIGRMNAVIMAFALTAMVLCGLFLGQEAPLWRYQLIFLMGALLAGLRGVGFHPVKDLETTPSLRPGPLWDELKLLWRDEPYRRVILFSLLAWLGIGLSLPFRPLFITALGFSPRFAALLTVPLVLGAYGAASQTWGMLTDRYGSRGAYALAGVGIVIAQLLMALPTTNHWTSGVIFAVALSLTAAAWGGFDAANMRRLFTIVPRQRQSLYLAVYIITINVSLSVGSFLGGVVVKVMRAVAPEAAGSAGFAHALDYRILYLLSAVAVMLSTVYSRRMLAMKETGAGRLLLYFRIRTQRFIMNGVAGDVFRRVFPEPEDDPEKREDRL